MFLLFLQCLVTKVFQDDINCNRLSSLRSPPPFLEGFLHNISPFRWSWPSICWSCRSLLECLSHLPPSPTSCELQQPRQYYSGVISLLMRQIISCGHLMWRWQILLELLLHHAPMAGPLCWSFFLGCPERLSLRACHPSFLRSRLAKDRIVLGNVSWQFGLFLSILGRFFLLDMGLGLCMKWVEAAEFFDPTDLYLHLFSIKFSYYFNGFNYMYKRKKKKKNKQVLIIFAYYVYPSFVTCSKKKKKTFVICWIWVFMVLFLYLLINALKVFISIFLK